MLNLNPPEIAAKNVIEICDLNEFLKYARGAPLLIYDPEYFPSPFLNEQRIRSVNCYAICVNFQGLPVILKYHKSRKNSNLQGQKRGINPKDVIDASMRSFINQIETQFNAVKGSIPGEKKQSIWDDVFLR